MLVLAPSFYTTKRDLVQITEKHSQKSYTYDLIVRTVDQCLSDAWVSSPEHGIVVEMNDERLCLMMEQGTVSNILFMDILAIDSTSKVHALLPAFDIATHL